MEGRSTLASHSLGPIYLRTMLSSSPPWTCQEGEKISWSKKSLSKKSKKIEGKA